MTPKDTGYFNSFDGTRIYYEVRGRGRPLVLNYGIGCVINHWQHQIKYFSQTHQVIAWDYRGHQKSETPRSPAFFSIAAIAKDLELLMQHLGFARADMWGHSFGAQVLLELYQNREDLFHSLILVNGFAADPLQRILGADFAPHVVQGLRLVAEQFPRGARWYWRRILNNPAFIPLSALSGGFNLHLSSIKDIEIYARGIGSMDLNVFFTLFEDMLRYDGRPILRKVRTPTLIIAGEKDGITPSPMQQELHQEIEGSEFQLIPYGSHCTQLDFPDFVNLRAEKFLMSLS